MSKTAHTLYIILMAVIILFTLAWPAYKGYTYYNTSKEERFFHPAHNNLKPSGMVGHGLGIVGSLSMIAGVSLYMLRKRSRKLSRIGLVKHWLEFHIFLCTIGPIMIMYHTAFKFGGIVSVSFWSMVAVFLSGIIGRFIYIQIPRTIEGRDLSLNEIRNMKGSVEEISLNNNLSKEETKKVFKLIREEKNLNRRIERLALLQKIFHYWHVAHLPFAIVMLIIMIIHVAVTVAFGFKWIF